MSRIKIGYIAGAILVIYGALFVMLPHTEYLPADGGLKIMQVKDFIKKDFASFSAVYNGSVIDPEMKFFPVGPPMAYKIGNEFYYVFPFYLTLIYAPAYLLFGIHGLILLCMVFGLLTLVVCMKIAGQVGVSEENRKWMLVFLGIASIIPIYSFLVGEYTLAIFLVTLSLYLLFLGVEKGRAVLFFLAGLAAGLSVFFRPEAGLYCFLLVTGMIIFRKYDKPMRDVALLVAALALCAIALTAVNYLVTGNILGLRGVEFMTKSGVSYSLLDRLGRLSQAFFFTRMNIGLFVAWPIYLFVFALCLKKIREGEDLGNLKFLLFIISIFFLSVPLMVYMSDGSILGPRYLSTLQPALAVVTFRVLDLKKMRTRAMTIISRSCIVFSTIIILIACVILYLFDTISHDVNTSIAAHVKSRIVVLYPGINYHTVLPHFHERIVVRIDPKKDWEYLRRETKKLGINEYTVLDYAEGRTELSHPGVERNIRVRDRYLYRGRYKKVLVENVEFVD